MVMDLGLAFGILIIGIAIGIYIATQVEKKL